MSRFFKVPWRLAAFVKRKMQLSIHTLLAAPTWLLFLETELKFMSQTAPSSIMAA